MGRKDQCRRTKHCSRPGPPLRPERVHGSCRRPRRLNWALGPHRVPPCVTTFTEGFLRSLGGLPFGALTTSFETILCAILPSSSLGVRIGRTSRLISALFPRT